MLQEVEIQAIQSKLYDIFSEYGLGPDSTFNKFQFSMIISKIRSTPLLEEIKKRVFRDHVREPLTLRKIIHSIKSKPILKSSVSNEEENISSLPFKNNSEKPSEKEKKISPVPRAQASFLKSFQPPNIFRASSKQEEMPLRPIYALRSHQKNPSLGDGQKIKQSQASDVGTNPEKRRGRPPKSSSQRQDLKNAEGDAFLNGHLLGKNISSQSIQILRLNGITSLRDLKNVASSGLQLLGLTLSELNILRSIQRQR